MLRNATTTNPPALRLLWAARAAWCGEGTGVLTMMAPRAVAAAGGGGGAADGLIPSSAPPRRRQHSAADSSSSPPPPLPFVPRPPSVLWGGLSPRHAGPGSAVASAAPGSLTRSLHAAATTTTTTPTPTPAPLAARSRQPRYSTAAAATAPVTSPSTPERPLNLCNAVNEALHVLLESDPTACVFGEDVAFGGVFRCTAGLGERFGRSRVFNTPLCEQGIAGFGIGLASEGVTALAELQFADYMFPAIDQLVNEAAKFRYRSGGEFSCGGLTVRAPYGAVGHGGHYHSQSPEAFFTQVPGLRVVVPSSPADAKGLLIAAARCPDPVIFLEPKALYRAAVEHVPLGDYEVPLGKARRLGQQGEDVTVVAWGAQAQVARAAADAARDAHGVSCDVLDLRSLLPWDAELVAESVSRTGRLVVTHEAPVTGGFGAEVAAEIARRCFLSLEAPPVRVCGADTPFPLVMEPLYLPGVERVLEAIVQSARF
jgi:2-oxoisovalerate dehydrogenase E1 component beta subunit